MYFNDKELAMKQVKLEIANREYVLTLIDDVIEVVKKFDGKVINKRLDTALQHGIEQNPNFQKFTTCCYRNEYSSFQIGICVPTRCVSIPMSGGGRKWEYLYDNQIIVCWVDNDNAIINGRIVSKHIIEALNKKRKEIEQYISDNKIALTKIDEWQKRWREIDSQITSLQKEIPYDVKRYFGMRFDLRNY